MTLDELLQNCKRTGIVVPPSMLVKIAVAAQIIGCSVRMLEQRREAGQPPNTVRLGGQSRYPISEILRFINGE